MPFKIQRKSGFALVTTMSLMVLLLVVAIGLLSLSTIQTRQSTHGRHQQQAQANARLAVMIALGELQKMAGPDQRVTARAAILEDPDSGAILPNRNWLGVWKTTHTDRGREWPLIGQQTGKGSAPYKYQNIYSDLRETERSLSRGQWRDRLLQGWLVSKSNVDADHTSALGETNPGVVEIVGRGILGKTISESDLDRQRVLVEKVAIASNGTGGGAYAWYISDENQKASINLDPKAAGKAHDSDQIPFLASQADSPGLIEVNGAHPFADYQKNADGHWQKIVSYRNAALTADSSHRQDLADALDENFHHLTVHGSGLFTNTVLGGLRRDLSPLLFGMKDEELITFTSPDGGVTPDFSSDDPIVPGPRKAVLGPSFGALRYWGGTKYLYSSTGVIDAQVAHKNPRRTSHYRWWPGWNIHQGEGLTTVTTDGYAFDGDKWASHAPKIHPVMTDCRWHYYFSYTGAGATQNFRTHLIPRVCLWNPYSVTMNTEELLVLMTNPLACYPRASSVGFGIDPGNSAGELAKWNPLGVSYGLEAGSKGVELPCHEIGGRAGLFPDSIYLGFVLQAATLKPGECLVFSPSTEGGGRTIRGGGITIKAYDNDNLSNNILSPGAEQGTDHFFHDYQGSFPAGFDRSKVRFRRITNYGVGGLFANNRPFILKSTPKANWNRSAQAICGMHSKPGLSYFPTLQLINNGSSGPPTAGMGYSGNLMGSAAASSLGAFGRLTKFTEDPGKDAPRNHQFGAKLLCLDEALTEATDIFLRVPGSNYQIRREWEADHIAYNPASIANWNVRPGLVSNSPSSPTSDSPYTNSLGAWMYQYLPLSPQDRDDMAEENEAGNQVKSPFFSGDGVVRNAALFDLPDPKFGALSMGSLRHAQLSPYSWHPSYIVGNSLVNLHAPHDTTSHLSQQTPQPYEGAGVPSGWDNLLGSGLGVYGIWSGVCASSDLLQIGTAKTIPTKRVDGARLTSKDEILAYDIAYEVNQNLWDGYFLSGMPMENDGFGFQWDPGRGTPLWNARYARNGAANVDDSENRLQGEAGLEFGFWHNAYLLKNRGAFNVNSTSKAAWTAFLSGLMGVERLTSSGELVGGGSDSVFARVRTPAGSAPGDQATVEKEGGWLGGRTLSSGEIETLAEAMVAEVKTRGPFLSLADFVNRRLAPRMRKSPSREDDPSMMGAIEAAIVKSNLNDRNPLHQTTDNLAGDNNRPEWKIEPDKQPATKAWGTPGHLTQGDVLEPIAPSITARGDSFVIRTYGESREGDKIMAKAWLEVVVERSPDYILPASIDPDVTSKTNGNRPADPALRMRLASGELVRGGLSPVNEAFGRRFLIRSSRWLGAEGR